MNNKKKEKLKRGKLTISGMLSFVLALISLGAGAYIGFMTLNYNYLTLGTMEESIITLFICSGLFIALGVVSISVGIKLLAMSKCTNFVFYTKKSIIISSLVFYSIVTIVAIVAIGMCFATIIPSVYMITTMVLSGLAIVVCIICFINLFKELHTFLNKIKKGEMTIQIEYPKKYIPASIDKTKLAKNSYTSNSLNIEDFSRELLRLDDMRNKGLINDQEYQQLKGYYLERVESKIF